MSFSNSQLGICVLPTPKRNFPRTSATSDYIHEILKHAGLAYITIAPEELSASLSQLRVLVTVGEGTFDAAAQDALRGWVQAGGAWLSLTGLCGLDDVLGAVATPPAYVGPAFGVVSGTRSHGEGYLPLEAAHAVLNHVQIPLHFYNSIAVQAQQDASVLTQTLDSHARATGAPGLIEHHFGTGHTLLVTPDVVGAVVRIQQGVGITRDGVPAPDGMGPVTDGVLKCDDGMVLDWHLDREPVPGIPGLSGFLQPVADQWRELILRAIFYLAQQVGATLPLLWLYPRNLPALAHISHDTDGNNPEYGERLLELLDEAAIKTTWCTIVPGYSKELTEKIRDAGHELATHYDALDHPWGEAEFESQVQELTALFGETPVSNKNHYTRWEGDTEFFDWCERQNIQIDGTKLPSKTGGIGFMFGTCHPYFPVNPAGQTLNVLELACLTQDLEIVAPTSLAGVLQAAVLRNNGILHLLFHPAHTHKPAVGRALVQVAREAHDAGLEFWTSRQINTWERLRRTAQWRDSRASSQGARVCVTGDGSLQDATLLVFNGANVRLDGQASSISTQRWGFDFQAVTGTLEAGREHVIEWEAA